MLANKVILNGDVIIDLTQDTATEADVVAGKTFHKADGTKAVGNYSELKKFIERTARNIELPSDLEKIGDYAFYQFSSLTNLDVPNRVAEICSHAFDCSANLTAVSLNEGLTTIADWAFNYCPALQLQEIPSSVLSIGAYAFRLCSSIRELTFKGTPTSIAANVFERCDNLTIIRVPFAEGAVANAPWGATNATIIYNYTGD